MDRLWTGIERSATVNAALLALLALLVVPFVLGGCAARLTIKNMTAHTMTPYPVVSMSVAPPRVMDVSGNLFHGRVGEIDRSGYDPIYYVHGVNDPERANGIHVELDRSEDGPETVTYHIVHYRVPPGEEGDDPAKQPIVLGTECWDLGSKGLPFRDRFVQITVMRDHGTAAAGPDGSGGWRVLVMPGS